MTTVIRAEISIRNRYWLPKHRFYELKHFCLQYPEWKQIYISLDGLSGGSGEIIIGSQNSVSDPTVCVAEKRLYFLERMEMIEQAASEAAGSMRDLMIRAVTEEISYEYLNANVGVPCCKDSWYVLYRRFFWVLDQMRK